jgi:arylsulfatase A-like enzyme
MPRERPNIVLFVIDDMGWTDAGCLGSDYYETPNIDRLAADGTVFTDGYANAPNCAPSRACLMSGQYTPRHGVYTVNNADRGPSERRKLVPAENTTELSTDHATIAEVLSEAGYTNGFFGKWHLGEAGTETGPLQRGFDVNVGGTAVGLPPEGYFPPYGLPNIEGGNDRSYLTDRLTDRAIQFIRGNRDSPFFCCFSHYAVHTPIQAKQYLEDRYEGKEPAGGHDDPTYAAMLHSVDDSVGRVLDTLNALELAEDTLVLFWSDNGGVGGIRDAGTGTVGLEITSQDPLRGGKGMLYEGGIRVPTIARWPGEIPAGETCAEPVIGSDFFPTFADIADAPVPDDHAVDGESLDGLLREGEPLDRDAIHWHFPAYLDGSHGTWRTTPGGVVRKADWKLIEYFEDNTCELYNLNDDIGEQFDLSGSVPEKAEELHDVMVEWREEVDAPVPTERNPEYRSRQ